MSLNWALSIDALTATLKVETVLATCNHATFKVERESHMLLEKEQVELIALQFMTKLKTESINAMVDVAANGMSILAAAEKQGVSHQSLSKNLVKLNQLQNKIVTTASQLSSAYVLDQNASALYFSNADFDKVKLTLTHFCEALGGNVKHGYLGDGVQLFLDGKVLNLFRNPDESFESPWSFDMQEAE